MNKQEALEIFSGVMLGDGGIQKWSTKSNKGIFYMGLSKVYKDERITMKDNYCWLEYIKAECLFPLGVDVPNQYPKYEVGISKGKQYEYVSLRTRHSAWLGKQYDRWYAPTGEWVVQGGREQYPSDWHRKGDTKRLPKNLIVTPRVLAHWFIGDGGMHRDSRLNRGVTVQTSLSTLCFSRAEIYQLMSMLHELDIVTTKPNLKRGVVKGSGLSIRIAQQSVDYLSDLIAPYMPSHKGLLQYKGNKSNLMRKTEEETKKEFENLRAKLRT